MSDGVAAGASEVRIIRVATVQVIARFKFSRRREAQAAPQASGVFLNEKVLKKVRACGAVANFCEANFGIDSVFASFCACHDCGAKSGDTY